MQTDLRSQPPARKDLHVPKITLGMPVFNGEKSISAALDSLLAQTFTDFELIISDNASTDGTEAICREYIEKDSRIRYVRHSENRGGANFWFLLDEAQCEYFVWAACDDIRSHDFLEINYNFLRRNPDYIASTSPVRFSGGTFNPVKMGDKSLDGPVEERILAFFECWHANGRYYSLFRRDALLSITTLRNENFLGIDWAIILELVCIGKFNRCSDGEVVLGTDGMSHSLNIFKIYRTGPLSWIIPFNKLILFTLKISRGFSRTSILKILKRLIILNNSAVIKQVLYEVKLSIMSFRRIKTV